jgi:hypothetical protein
VARITLAAVACGATGFLVHPLAARLLEVELARRSAVTLLVAFTAAGLVYALASRLLAIPEWDEALTRLRRRFGRGTGR